MKFQSAAINVDNLHTSTFVINLLRRVLNSFIQKQIILFIELRNLISDLMNFSYL